jgi:hypothetical protein
VSRSDTPGILQDLAAHHRSARLDQLASLTESRRTRLLNLRLRSRSSVYATRTKERQGSEPLSRRLPALAGRGRRQLGGGREQREQ